MAETVVLFGGSFNPIHNGHLIAVRSVAEQLGAARVVLIPSANPPHKPAGALASAEDRLEMARVAVAGEPGWEVSDCELSRAGPSFTIDTVAHFRQSLGPDVELCWLIGADSLPELASWYQIDALVEMCRIVTAARPGWETPDLTGLRARLTDEQVRRLVADMLETPRIDIAATEIRRRVREGRSIRYLVPDAVHGFIHAASLYSA
ncbi:MAG: nicotinate (nicotinamide) nucleotide adenylyltransferase [Phycisphaerae bacterium]|nr:nicotinate (nicotinamide) nucleotide adenylyltransferase [Phycisphaerae bacterium]